MRTYSVSLLSVFLLCGCIPVLPEKEEAATPEQDAHQRQLHEPEIVEETPVEAEDVEQKKENPKGCTEQGGTLRTEKKPPNSTIEVCVFSNNYQCEKQALLNGICRAGGVRITGYSTPAARYCAIIGGRYTKTSSSGEEQGSCALPSGTRCDVWKLWNGTCS